MLMLSILRRDRSSSVGIATTLRAAQSGNRIPVGANFFAPVQTDPLTHLTSYTIYTWFISVGKAAGTWR
jgi:hypothetical protein